MTNNPNTTNPTSVNRRAMLAGSSAVVGAMALAGPALANGGDDAELRALWDRYVPQYRVYKEADKVAHERRDKFDAAHPDALNHETEIVPGERWRALEPERIKYGVEQAYDVSEHEYEKLGRITKRIRKAKAETMFGIGVKLAVSKHFEEWDNIRAMIDALEQIGRVTGIDFLTTSCDHLTSCDYLREDYLS